jgi:ABC-type nitrate/sulfonate/bicarbonate transport system permease component
MAASRSQTAQSVGARAVAPTDSRAPRAVRRGRRLAWWSRAALPVGTTLALLALWEVLARAGILLPDQVPPFSDVLQWLVDHGGDGRYRTAIGQTLWHWFAGLIIGGLAGVVLGVALGSVPLVQRLLNVPLEVLRPIPAIVYLPLLILVMGSRSQTVIVLAALGAFWPMMFQAIYGVRAIDPQAMETGKVFGLTRSQRLRTIMLPSVLPYLATGLRISSSLALVVAVSTELVGGIPGLGAEVAAATQNANYAAIYALLIVSGVLGLVLNGVLESVERRLLRWHVSHRGVSA